MNYLQDIHQLEIVPKSHQLAITEAGKRWLVDPVLYARLFEGHWRHWLDRRLAFLLLESYLPDAPSPSFVEEMTPSLAEVSPIVLSVLRLPEKEDLTAWWLACFEKIQMEGFLLLMGQRRTSASLKEAEGIPFSYPQLLAAATQPADEKNPLSMVARALDKHSARSEDPWWGKSVGNAENKNKEALFVLQTILQTPTWWNVFVHYKKGIAFEVRLPEGYGARWGDNGDTFVGFLEPFDETLGGTSNRVK